MARSYSAGEGSRSSALREKAAKIEAAAAKRAAKVRDEAMAAEAAEKVEGMVATVKSELTAIDASQLKSEYSRNYPEGTVAFKIPEFENGVKTKYFDEIWDVSFGGSKIPWEINPATGKLYNEDKARVAERIAERLVGEGNDEKSNAQRKVLVKEMVEGGIIDKITESAGSAAMSKFYTNLDKLNEFDKKIRDIPDAIKSRMRATDYSVSTKDYDGDNAISSAAQSQELSRVFEEVKVAAPIFQKILNGDSPFGKVSEKVIKKIDDILFNLSMTRDAVNAIKPIVTTRWMSKEKFVIEPDKLDYETGLS